MIKKLKNKLSKIVEKVKTSKIVNKVKSLWKKITHPTETIVDTLVSFEDAIDNMLEDAEDMLARVAALNLLPDPPDPSPS